jgi:hypothetical protein
LNEEDGKMAGKRFGSLFQNIRDKSPTVAKRLREMASGKPETDENEAQKPTTPTNVKKETAGWYPPRRQSTERPKGLIVEKKAIAPKAAPHKKKGPTSQRQPFAKKRRDAKPKADKKTKDNPKAYEQGRFFDGIPENAHQFRRVSETKQLDVVGGVDFGTSSTKIVVRAPYALGNPAFAIPFGDLAHESLAYLLPTRVWVDDKGLCSLVHIPNASILTDIKITLIKEPGKSIEPAAGPPCSASAVVVATAYLALALRYTRCWFIANKRNAFGDFDIRWSFNLGLPAAIDDDIKLRETYDLIGKAAWLLSRRPGAVTLEQSQKAINDFKCERFDDEDMCWEFDSVPEVIAEVTGYARSHARDEGLHLLVDVGASTLDACTFILHDKEGDDDFPILTADVGLLGAKKLHAARVEGAQNAIAVNAAELIDIQDPLGVVPDDLSSYIPPEEKIAIAVREAEVSFQNACERLLQKALFETRKRRDPHSSRWSRRLPIFFCGGAANIELYDGVIFHLEEWLKKYIPSSEGLRRIRLPKPETLEADIDNDKYHRLAVAWGLSHESFNIGTYSRPSEIEDIPTRNVRRHDENFISKDMV